MDRREAVKRLTAVAGAGSMLPVLEQWAQATGAGTGPGAWRGWSLQQTGQQPGGDTSPAPAQFFTPVEFADFDAVSEAIIPATDTPGAHAAGVARYLDMLLAASSAASVDQERTAGFKTALATLATLCQSKFGQPRFAALSADQQQQALAALEAAAAGTPERKAFDLMRDSTLYAYYTSEVGMVQELHYQMDYRDSYPGCTHPEHQS